jgi:hypothetical protein
MDFNQFNTLVAGEVRPVILVEGTRELPEEDAGKLTAFARWMAETYPQAVFRTGNADGADTAFANGVAQVDPTRIEYVLPYSGHRKKTLESGATQIDVSKLTAVAEERAVYHTKQASPEYGGMMARRIQIPQLRAKARYILRDTVKVIGSDEADVAPATVGVFYVNVKDPMKGGTGHTIRVCQKHGVPVVYQAQWMAW